MESFLELYEGLKRAQRLRIEDQRGTAINAELPEFLKPSSYPDRIQVRNCLLVNFVKQLYISILLKSCRQVK